MIHKQINCLKTHDKPEMKYKYATYKCYIKNSRFTENIEMFDD